MTKTKAILITVAFMVIFGCVLYMLWEYQLRSYYTMMQILGFYGFVMAGLHLGKWLSKEEPKPQKSYREWAECPEEEV